MSKVTLVYAPPSQPTAIKATTAAANTNRTWVLNGTGSASLELSEDTPDIANIVALDTLCWLYEDGVPPWAGFVEERSWGDAGGVTLSLRSAEGLLQKQITRQSLVLGADGSATTGAVGYAVFESAILRNSSVPLYPGVFDAAGARYVEYQYTDAYEAISKLTENDRAAFWVDEDLRLHLRTARGADKREIIKLEQGINLTEVAIKESSANRINAAVGLGEGNDITTKPKKALKFGTRGGIFRSEVLSFSNAKDAETVRKLTVEEINKRRTVAVTVDCAILRNCPEWGNFWLGDTVTVLSTRVPWQNEYSCRVVGAEVGETDTARLILTEIPPEDGEQPVEWLLT